GIGTTEESQGGVGNDLSVYPLPTLRPFASLQGDTDELPFDTKPPTGDLGKPICYNPVKTQER
ncbi:MAG: hypothetical protein V3R96_04755, partial [Dehalococcoidales bacterium]